MIDCLYTGPATDSIDCWWGERPPFKVATSILQQLVRMSDCPSPLLMSGCYALGSEDLLRRYLEEINERLSYIPAKAPQSLQDRVPEKG